MTRGPAELAQGQLQILGFGHGGNRPQLRDRPLGSHQGQTVG
jgi:hypothetical protein